MANPFKPRPKPKTVAPSVVNLQNDLAEAMTQATLAADLENDLAAANQRIQELQRDLQRAKDQLGRMAKSISFTDEDERYLAMARATLEFERDFNSGKIRIRYNAAAPGHKKGFQAPSMTEVLKRVRTK